MAIGSFEPGSIGATPRNIGRAAARLGLSAALFRGGRSSSTQREGAYRSRSAAASARRRQSRERFRVGG